MSITKTPSANTCFYFPHEMAPERACSRNGEMRATELKVADPHPCGEAIALTTAANPATAADAAAGTAQATDLLAV